VVEHPLDHLDRVTVPKAIAALAPDIRMVTFDSWLDTVKRQANAYSVREGDP